MKILARNLKKEEIALQKGYMKWYKVINNEGFTTVVKQKCGKRRLSIISKIIEKHI